MHGLHARLPKNFVLEERLERYASVIEADPARWRGQWARACAPVGAPAFREVRLDLGCGKGSFIVEAARREPDVLFLGMDSEPICVAYAAQRVFESGLPNALVLSGNGMRVREYFAPDELGRIYLNFPTPFPRKRDAAMRMASFERLMDFRGVLAPGAEVRFKTDSQPLYDFMCTQLPIAGYELLWNSTDARAERPGDPASEYEERLGAQGARVYALFMRPAEPAPVNPVQTAELSLAAYLPHDLDALEGMGYAPHGMQATVLNLKNRAAKGADPNTAR